VDQANLLLQQIEETPRTRFILVPNQHIGAWECGFMPQWITRDYLARRGGAKFQNGTTCTGPLSLARPCPLLHADRRHPHCAWFLEVNTQPEVGDEGYDKGAEILAGFFHNYLRNFLAPDLSDTGRKIIECCLDNGSLDDYEAMLPRSDWY